MSGYQLGELKDEVNRFWNLQKNLRKRHLEGTERHNELCEYNENIKYFHSFVLFLEQHEGKTTASFLRAGMLFLFGFYHEMRICI